MNSVLVELLNYGFVIDMAHAYKEMILSTAGNLHCYSVGAFYIKMLVAIRFLSLLEKWNPEKHKTLGSSAGLSQNTHCLINVL